MQRKQPLQKFMSIVLAFLCVVTVLVLPAAAAEDSGMVFAVNPIMPDNQTDSGLGYFDVVVTPGAKQTFEIKVLNKSNREITMEVGVASASTSPQGSIDYTRVVETDETMAHPFADMVTLPEELVKVPANSERIIRVDVQIPDSAFEGVVLGGIRVKDITDRLLRESEEKKSGEGAGIGIFNEYEGVIGAVLRENDTVIAPNFELTKVTTGLSNYEASIFTHIRNSEPRIIKGAHFSGAIYPKGSEEGLFSIESIAVDFAPNSVMEYEFVDRAGYGLDSGDYIFKGKIEFEGQEWLFNEEFVITKEEAVEVNQASQNQQQSQKKNTDLSFWVIGAVLLGLIILLVLLLLLKRASKKR